MWDFGVLVLHQDCEISNATHEGSGIDEVRALNTLSRWGDVGEINSPCTSYRSLHRLPSGGCLELGVCRRLESPGCWLVDIGFVRSGFGVPFRLSMNSA